MSRARLPERRPNETIDLAFAGRRFAVTVGQLQSWNNMGGSTRLRTGQLLTIHVGGSSDVGS